MDQVGYSSAEPICTVFYTLLVGFSVWASFFSVVLYKTAPLKFFVSLGILAFFLGFLC